MVDLFIVLLFIISLLFPDMFVLTALMSSGVLLVDLFFNLFILVLFIIS